MAQKAPYSIRGIFHRATDVREGADKAARERVLAARRDRARQKRERAAMAINDKPGIQRRIEKQIRDSQHGQKLVTHAAKRARRANVVAHKVYNLDKPRRPTPKGGRRTT